MGEHKVLVGELTKTASHYVLQPRLGTWLKFFATLLGRMPPDSHAWVLTDEVPAFVRFEGSLCTGGPIWRIGGDEPPLARVAALEPVKPVRFVVRLVQTAQRHYLIALIESN